MFGQQQPRLRLQQLLQPPPPPPGRVVAPSQQQMLTLQAASPAALLNANPMLQRALLLQQMQGNLRGFNVAPAPVLQQFFPQATRHSLLGPPPVGVSLKPPHLAFSALPFHRQNQTFRKDFPRISERRKREVEAASGSSAPGQGEEGAAPVGKQPGSPPSETPLGSLLDGEPAAKQPRSEAEISYSEDTTGLPNTEEAGAEPLLEDAGSGESTVAADALGESFEEEAETSEVVSNAGALKVTIRHSSESRAISTTTALKPGPARPGPPASPTAALQFYCYICRSNCCSQQNFQTHLAGVQHQQRLQEIQRGSDVCLVSLLPVAKELPVERDGESQQRWCNTCQLNFRGALIKHRRTPEHKLAKRFLRPFCTVCSRYFKTPRKFVEHMKSLEHKQKAREVRLAEKEVGGPEDSEELITVDAVGCFEEQDEEEEEEEEDEAGEADQLDPGEAPNPQVGKRDAASGEDLGGNVEYSPETVYGLDFLVPVAGFFCQLCRKFYSSDSATRLGHCKSLMHFENFRQYRASQLQVTAAFAEVPSPPLQGVADRQTPATSDAEDAAVGHEGMTALGSPSEPPGAMQRCPEEFETEDICGALVIDEKRSPSPASDGSWGQDAGVSGERAGLGLLQKVSKRQLQILHQPSKGTPS